MAISSPALICERPLYQPPPITRFQKVDREQLIGVLADLENNTCVEAPSSSAELTLRDDCTISASGYRYTSDGFRQICRLLGPGVGRLIPDLAGVRRRASTPDTFLNGTLAIGIFNALINLRFAAFAPYQLVKNTRTRMIDGVIGQTHRHLTNSSFFHICEAASQEISPAPDFHAAALIGRRLICWWRSPQPFLVCTLGPSRWTFHTGYYFRNDEITGASARATPAIMSQAGVCLATFKSFGARVNHQGKDFATRLMAELHRVVTHPLPLAEWTAKVPESLGQNLGFVAGSDGRTRRQRTTLLATHLRRLGIDFSMAAEIIDATLRFGRRVGQPREDLDPVQLEELFASRTVVDLLLCLLHLARRLDTTRRENLEQAAFSLLIGKLF